LVTWKSVHPLRGFSRYAVPLNCSLFHDSFERLMIETRLTSFTTTGWYNNCASWSGYYSRGPARAFIDLNMKQTIEQNIFKFYLPITGVSLFIQLSLAGFIIWMNWEVISFTVWNDEENRRCIERGQMEEATPLMGSQQGIQREGANDEIELSNMTDQSGAVLMGNRHGLPAMTTEGWNVPFGDPGSRELNR
jgi:hypothetical protein